MSDFAIDIIENDNKSSVVDLIVLSYNGLNTTKEFLNRFVQHTDLNKCRLIWIDNGSDNETVEYLKNYLSLKIVNSILCLCSKNTGVIGGRNLGFEISEKYSPSPLLMFLDNDQFVLEGWLDHHLAVLDHGYDLVGVEAWQLNPVMMPSYKLENLRSHFNYVGCGGMIIRREVTDKIGMFDERFNPAYFEDPDFCWRSHEAGFKMGWNMKAKIIHMPHQTLGTIDRKTKQRMLSASLQKFRNKWKGKKLPIVKQKMLSEFK